MTKIGYKEIGREDQRYSVWRLVVWRERSKALEILRGTTCIHPFSS